MGKVKEIMQHYAENAYVEHEDHTKCGQCWREKIKSQVASEFLAAGKLDDKHLNEMFDEIDKRWRETELFLRVKKMLDAGQTLESISEQLELEGIEI